MLNYDVTIVGGGIIGLATAMELLRRAGRLQVVVVEKESQVGMHQTSHNSGVIHSGLYYRPGSTKATTCVAGAKLLVDFCETSGIAYQLCGKVVVATTSSEIPTLETLYHWGIANGIPGLSLIGPERLREIEPHANGLKALHVPGAGIIDYRTVATAFAKLVQQRGGQIKTAARVHRLVRRDAQWILETTVEEIHSKYLITCPGLYADRVARWAGAPSDLSIIPFRGDYYDVSPQRQHVVNAMIYPVPDPTLPFLGVHLTRSIYGGIHAGPNAVLAFKREGYRKYDLSIPDVLSLVGHAGFWRMARRYWRVGFAELWRALHKSAFVEALQRLVPEIQSQDLQPAGSGVRAQAVRADGSLVDDFDIVQATHAIHVRNVPSPAATASIRIGQIIADRALGTFELAETNHQPSTSGVR